MDVPAGAAADQLSPSQQEALEQLVTITDQDEVQAAALLRRSNWSVPVAIAKFFDGEPEQDLPPIPAPPPAQDRAFHNLVAEINMPSHHIPPSQRTEPARRVVPVPLQPMWRPPLLMAILLSPFNLGYRVIMGLWSAVQYVAMFIPGLRNWLAAPTPPLPADAPVELQQRRPRSPRDAAVRFRQDFEEQYDSKLLPFEEDGYAQVFDRAKEMPKLLLAVLLSPEHDDTDSFVRDTLLAPEVTDILSNPDKSHYLIWGGNVREPEAFQVATEFQATQFPFAAIVCVTPKEGGVTRMGTIKRLVCPMSPEDFAGHLQDALLRCSEDLAAVQADRIDRESTRTLRAQQDDAYERSLAADRERARQRQETEAAAAAEARRARAQQEEAARQAMLAKQWRKWRKTQLAAEPAAPIGSGSGRQVAVVRVALKLPEASGGERVRRAFSSDTSVEELYAFADCLMADKEKDEEAQAEDEEEEVPLKPDGYTHRYKFRIASVLPREIHEPSENKTLLEAIGKSASLVIEDIEEDEDEDEDEQRKTELANVSI